MTMFRLGSLIDWEPLAAGGTLELEVPEPPALVTFRVLAAGAVDVFADQGDGPQLVASGDGNLWVKFSAIADVTVSYSSRDEAVTPEVWVKRRPDPQVVPESDAVSFTTIQPRGVQPADNVRRMMHIMELNNRRRERLLRDEIARLAALRGPQTATEAPGTPATPAASTAASVPPVEPPAAG